MIVKQLWDLLESDAKAADAGLLFRRIAGERDIRVAVEKPSGLRMLMLGVGASDVDSGFQDVPTSAGFVLRAVPDTTTGRLLIQLQMGQAAFREVFSALVEDVVGEVSAAATDRLALTALLRRLAKWQEFLRAVGPDGLTGEQQRGLYGELYFLAHELVPAVGPSAAVLAWAGPAGAIQDFQLPGRAIEVKVATGKQLQKLRISSERQLDDLPDGGTLLLKHFSLDARDTGASTLPMLVEQLRATLDVDPAALVMFQERLMAAGYHDAHADHYRKVSYSLREQNCFRVDGAFPRVTEKMLPAGTGDVTYAIAVSACIPFKISDALVREILAGSG